ncbi:hypothetical protein [Mesorhizobium australicum]|uniref:OsmC-like protein n=1 Tax=Mesorhizobium australicum TaxID=536018 RepID=A0A1X7N6A6_9HYPH|nr:hypothetical protein [Mesorhizobium australicum]SMH32893.1 hypothetical protein SAMN02982922_1348 [Mesorhizobium australicum]
MSSGSQDSILRYGDPLGFRTRIGASRPDVVVGAGDGCFRVAARAAEAQQKEGVLSEGDQGSTWRLTADEGATMNGHDIAPFPLGYLIAGVAGDLSSRLEAAAGRARVDLVGTAIDVSHTFGASGSFIHSTATATSEAASLDVALTGSLSAAAARSLLEEAMDTSPAIAFLREPARSSSFALTINGRQRLALGGRQSVGGDFADPFLTLKPPRPEGLQGDRAILEKPGITEIGEAPQIPFASTGKRYFTIAGRGTSLGHGRFATETWIARPGMSHFRLLSDDSPADTAPSALGLLSTGIAFCFLTQLHRYVEAQKLAIRSPRLVQQTAFTGGADVRTEVLDTHLFLNGDAPEEMHENLLNMAARTCFMHAAAAASVTPAVTLRLNGELIS